MTGGRGSRGSGGACRRRRRGAGECVAGRAAKAGLPGQTMRTNSQLATQGAEVVDDGDVMGARLTVDPAGAIDQAGRTPGPGAAPPLGSRPPADADRPGRGADRPAACDALDQDQPTTRGETRVSMGHEGPSSDCGFLTNSRRIRALTRQQPDWELDLGGAAPLLQ